MSDAPGHAFMEIPRDASGIENFYLSRLTDPKRPATSGLVEVEVQTLDALVPADACPSFIKIDVEGHELACLRGAAGLIARCAPAWLVEITTDPDDEGTDAFALFGLLKAAGCDAYWFDGTQLRRRRRDDRAVNHFFLREQHVERLESQGFRSE